MSPLPGRTTSQYARNFIRASAAHLTRVSVRSSTTPSPHGITVKFQPASAKPRGGTAEKWARVDLRAEPAAGRPELSEQADHHFLRAPFGHDPKPGALEVGQPQAAPPIRTSGAPLRAGGPWRSQESDGGGWHRADREQHGRQHAPPEVRLTDGVEDDFRRGVQRPPCGARRRRRTGINSSRSTISPQADPGR